MGNGVTWAHSQCLVGNNWAPVVVIDWATVIVFVVMSWATGQQLVWYQLGNCYCVGWAAFGVTSNNGQSWYQVVLMCLVVLL